MSEIKAIETEYAGCRFRSRLEARWGVFFDTLGVKWLYEPQGYVLGNGDRYLPDFWLPEVQLWVEVKGAMNEADWIKLHFASAADGLPLTYESGKTPLDVLGREGALRIPAVNRILILGEVPLLESYLGAQSHIVTTLAANGPALTDQVWLGKRLLQLGPLWQWVPRPNSDIASSMGQWPAVKLFLENSAAYEAARKARFEHGERG